MCFELKLNVLSSSKFCLKRERNMYVFCLLSKFEIMYLPGIDPVLGWSVLPASALSIASIRVIWFIVEDHALYESHNKVTHNIKSLLLIKNGHLCKLYTVDSIVTFAYSNPVWCIVFLCFPHLLKKVCHIESHLLWSHIF